MPNDLPLPVDLSRSLIRERAEHLHYLYYRDTPHIVTPEGKLKESASDAKGKWIEETAGRANRALRLPAMQRLLESVAARQQALAQAAAPDAFCVDYPTAARLLVGTGYKNTLEVGLGLHPLYGVPYLPGTSVKGLVRAWFETHGEATPAELLRLFGSATKDEKSEEEHQVGALSFFDALPLPGVQVEPDVLTPHFAPYYQEPSKEAPAVWHDPNPVAFLAVAAGATFRFVVTARAGTHFAQTGDLARISEGLSQALAWLGVGAKTSNGYGRFDTPALRDLFSF